MARTTEGDWKRLGESEPWYGVLSEEKFRVANITDEAKEEFYAQGTSEIEWLFSRLTALDPEFSPKTALDFGSGLGRLSFAMSAKCESVTGVDISPGMRAEADRQKSSRGMHNVEFVEAIPQDRTFDWINSYIVLQHIDPVSGYQIIRNMLASLNPGGWTSLQMPFAHDERAFISLQRDASAFRYDGDTATILEAKDTPIGDMAMYDYDMNKVLFMFTRHGISNINLIHTDHGGSHGFWLLGRK